MKVNQIFIINYREFRSTFISDADAKNVMNNLYKDVEKTVNDPENPHVKTSYWPSYDDEGFAEFETVEVHFFHNKVNVKVKYITTAK